MKKGYKNLIISQFFIIFFIICVYIFLNSKAINIIPKCYINEKLGILCPACYGTRFLTALSNLKIKTAFLLHPVFFLFFIYLMLIDITYIINVLFNKNIKIFKWWHSIIFVILLLIFTVLRNIF